MAIFSTTTKKGGGWSSWNLPAKRICFTLPAVADPVGTKEPISWNFAISFCFIYIKNVIPTSPGKNGHMLKIWTLPWKKSKISLKYRSVCYKQTLISLVHRKSSNQRWRWKEKGSTCSLTCVFTLCNGLYI